MVGGYGSVGDLFLTWLVLDVMVSDFGDDGKEVGADQLVLWL